MKASPRLAELALAFVCLLWGATFVLVKNALDDISPTLFLAIRFSIASILLTLLIWRGENRSATVGPAGLWRECFFIPAIFCRRLG